MIPIPTPIVFIWWQQWEGEGEGCHSLLHDSMFRPWQPIEAAAQLESLRPGSLSPASVHGLCAFLYVPLYVPIRSGRPPHISVYGHLASGVSGKPSRQKGRSYTITLMSGGLLSKAVIRPYTSRATLTLLLVICYTFLYVPYTLHILSPFEMKESCHGVYVPARSVQPSRYRCALLYVPYTFCIRSP